MFEIEGYHFINRVYVDTHIAIYRGTRNRDSLPVIAKSLKARYPTAKELNQLEYEYNIGDDLDIPGVVKYYSIENVGYGKAIIMEDFGAISLARYIRSHQVDIQINLRIIIAAAEILANIHRRNIIHQDINPYNILINPETKQVKITDFSISIRVKRETQAALEPEALKGTLAYISPEQTGRMNRSIDYRSDFYSLGVTFYEMLTGKRPFELDDPMELVHAHMARQAIEPHEINNALPAVISKIVMKLLAKNAEDRYQSISGLKADLEECYRQSKAKGIIEDFTIGEKDISDVFVVPEKLYGRETEIAFLNELFHRAAKGEKIMAFFSGPVGIGKSALVNEIHKPVSGRRSYFIDGKYDRFERHLPNSAIIQAFSKLIVQLLTTKSTQLEKWKKEILDAVGNNGQVIIDVLPRIKLIIGEQPEVPELPPLETENRLNMVFRNFFTVFARESHPLVLFLDNMQWADDASLLLIDTLFADPELHYCLLLGAYREEEVNKSHLLARLIKKWQRTTEVEPGTGEYAAAKLENLTTPVIGQLLADTLRCTEKKTKNLAELVHSKTSGNPFFIHEFLKKLREDRMIEFKQGWTWDVSNIRQAGITDNVVELMTEKLSRLADDTLAALKIAACVGIEFTLSLIAQVSGKPENDILEDLDQAIGEGILLKTGEQGKFSHNKVQEAVYLLMGEKERRELHLKIGRRKLEEPEEQGDETRFFDIANHLNKAGDLLNDEERIRLAGINLKAGQKAKAAIAYDLAYRFFRQGMECLPRPVNLAWERAYELTLALYTASSEAGYLAGEFEEAEKYFTAVLENAKELLDKIKMYEIKIHVFIWLEKNIEAVNLSREALKMLGLQMPPRAGKLTILKEFLAVFARLKLRRGGTASLIDLPELTDPTKLAIARILTTCTEPTYMADPAYFPIIILKLLHLTLKHGNSKYSAYAYAAYASILSDLLGNITEGQRFGELALNILKKIEAGNLKAKIYFIYGTGVNHWRKHMQGDLQYLLESYKSGTETGDLRYASYAVNSYISRLFFTGTSLTKIKKTIAAYYPVLKKYNRSSSLHECELWQQFVLTLSGDIEGKFLLTGEIDEKIDFVSQWITNNDMNRLGLYTMCRLILPCFLGHFEIAVDVAKKGQKYVESLVGDIFGPEFYFYYSIALIGDHCRADEKKQQDYLKQLRVFQEKMKKWAVHAPENFEHKYLLIKAGRSWLLGRTGEAVTCYSRSVSLARKNGFIHEEAIACECASRFYYAVGLDEIALNYTRKAHYLYEIWHAKAKVEALEEQYPELLQATSGKKETASTGSSESTTPSLDFNAVIKASQVISGEIVLVELLEKLVKILMENAGARRISLMLKKGDRLFVEAEGKTGEREISVLQGIPVEDNDLPQSIIRFVDRTREFVVLNDSSRDSPFSQDAYIFDKPPMSLLCMPVVHQDTLVGILYLENKLSLDAFTEDHQETLKVLAAQAAVSIQNALLYENLAQAEERVRTVLDTTKKGFLELNDNGYITDLNPEMCTISGRSREELLGSAFSQLLSPGDREPALQKFSIHNLEESNSLRLTIRKPDSTAVQCLINATPLFDEKGNRQGSFAMVTDMSEYEKKDRQLRQAQKMETVGTLAGGLAHDFNNILGGITGSLSLLQLETRKKEGDAEEIEKYLDVLEESAVRAADIVRRLLALSRKEELAFEPVDLNTTIRNVMKICRNTFEKSTELNPIYYDDPAVVLADPMQLEQILLNLCVNASHAMTIMRKEGQRWGGTLTVFIEKFYANPDFCEIHQGAEEGYYWKFSVRDEGVGMDSETVSRIFEPFFTTKIKSSGTGLGLSMVYNIIKQHKGLIDVVSKPEKGSSFDVYLPEYRELLEPKKQKTEAEIVKGEGLILVIDDEPIMRKITVKILEKAGYSVIFAKDGEEGVELFRKHRQKLMAVLLDMQMPKKSGRETYLDMREISPDVKVLLASGFQRDERVEAILRLGVHGFIEKPYTFGQLVKAIQTITAVS